MINETYNLNGNTLKNKLVMAPISLSFSQVGFLTEEEADVLVDRSQECGMLIVGSHAVSEAACSIQNGWKFGERWETSGLMYLKSKCEQNNVKVIVQLYDGEYHHENSKKIKNRYCKEASLVESLTEEQINFKIGQFKEAVNQAIIMGIDGVEIHAANSLLIQQFLSPYFNQRHDEWGGSASKRESFLKKILEEINLLKNHYQKPEFIVGVRLIPEELPGGIELKDTLHFLQCLHETDLNYVHLSLRLWNQVDSDGKLIIEQIKQQLSHGITLIASGQVINQNIAEACLEYCDLVSIGMGLLNKSYFGISNFKLEEPIQKFLGWKDSDKDQTIFSGKYSNLMGPLSTMTSLANGNFSPSEKEFYISRAGHLDYIFFGATAVSSEGDTISNGAQLFDNNHVVSFKALNDQLQQKSCGSVIQLYHGGQYANLTEDIKQSLHRFLNEGEVSNGFLDWLSQVYMDFTKSMLLAEKAGFKGIELNFTDPYLLGDMLNSINSKMGMLLIKALLKILYTIKEKCLIKNFTIGIRLSTDNFTETMDKRLYLQEFVSEVTKYIDYISATVKDYRTLKALGMAEILKETSDNKLPYLISGKIKSERDKEIVYNLGLIPVQVRSYIFSLQGNLLSTEKKYKILSSNVLLNRLRIPKGLELAIKESSDWFID